MKLAIIGYGQMAAALAARWFDLPEIEKICLIRRSFATQMPENLPAHVTAHSDIQHLSDWRPDVILLAVKPAQMAAVLTELKPLITQATFILTVATALPLAFYEAGLHLHQPIVRIMPNTPSRVAQGMSVGVANPAVTLQQRGIIETLFNANGAFAWLNDETKMDVVAAISGSGPAYFYRFTELLAAWGQQQGLPHALADLLARQTLIGSGALLASRDQPPAELRGAVTSKGGVTEAALKTFDEEARLFKLISSALDANIARGQEMAVAK